MSDLVAWSVMEVNRRNAGLAKPLRMNCPKCGIDLWTVYHGIDERYSSTYNPGEYVVFTCTGCGYQDEQQC
jgi:hypothetical protein